ncbi:DUF2806 domain-containing protein [Nitrosospira sp. Nsp1]|uniref:DUF2806 domain-containing protein n=1 Tax=Nitrosospira sp. Nsp1 TaxID=136547 RepID=UPI0008871B85|nr:DUF2806 domain-containing protein [Nitrosospira sp. Nsp1]SCX43680.1 Protein of unknown function [Nitrosospira sp. Nsp1]
MSQAQPSLQERKNFIDTASAMSSKKEIDTHTPDLNGDDTALFTSLCQFVWIQGEPLPLIYDPEHAVYTKQGINLRVLKHLESIDLISFEAAGYVKRWFGKHTRLFYFGQATKIQFVGEANNQLDLGYVLLTEKGKALATVFGNKRNQEFYEYVIGKWFQQGMVISSILANR